MRIYLSILAASMLSLVPMPNRAEINIYTNTQANMLSSTVKNALYRVYVPNELSGTVSVIDPVTYQVVDTFHTGSNPQHVVPSYDLGTLWVLNNRSNSVTPINPMTGKPGNNIRVIDPYNLYFTPDGKFAIVVCEARRELQFRDPKTMQLQLTIPMSCRGANHMEFSADGNFGIVTCEYSGQLMKIDLINHQVLGYLQLASNLFKQEPDISIKNAIVKKDPSSEMVITTDGQVQLVDDHIQNINRSIKRVPSNLQSMPQDIRSSADGKIFFVADMMQDGLVLIDPAKFIKVGFIATGVGTHAVYPSRDGKLFYISNRGCHRLRCGPHGPGSVSVVDPNTRTVIATWSIPLGGSPDMGNVTADGRELWLSGRYDNEVYVFDTIKGMLSHRIPVQKSPHGLAVWPQPGQYSLGHTGNMR